MRIIIPAAGRGLRLRPITNHIPKPLVYVGKKRMIDYIMESYENINPSKIIIIIGYKGELLKEYLINTYSYNFEFIEQKSLLGLADAVYLGMEDEDEDEDVLIQLSDTILDVNITDFVHNNTNTLAVYNVDNPSRFGIVFDNDDNEIYDLIEKPDNIETGKAIVGLYYFNKMNEIKKAIEYIKDNNIKTKNEYQITDAMKYMINNKSKILSYNVNKWIDCGNNEMLINSNRVLLNMGNKINYFDNAKIINSEINENVSIFGKCEIINSKIKNSIVFPGTIIIDSNIENSVIGGDSLIKEYNGKIITGFNTLIEKED